jgi:tRNA threonylcarbamoyladenosine biosynthesis protein TsaB
VITLGLDTATPDTAVAVCEGEELLAERALAPEPGGRPRHGPDLLRLIQGLVEEAGGWQRIELLATGIGPGSFTGVRIGVATARALAQARRLPLAGVQSTAALAAGIPASGERVRLAVIDARRGEVFGGALRPGADAADEPVLAAPERLVEACPAASGAIAAGDGAVRFRSELEALGIVVLPDGNPSHRLLARHVCTLGLRAGAGSPADVRPLYLRRPDAERWRNRDGSD